MSVVGHLPEHPLGERSWGAGARLASGRWKGQAMKNHHLLSEEGATATEYLILVVFIALALFVGAQFLGGVLNAELQGAGSTIQDGGT